MTLQASQIILPNVNQARLLGQRVLEDGTELIGHIPHTAPEAYLHVLFPPLSEEQITQMETAVGRTLPNSLWQFYRNFNGLKLFAYSLNLYGLRRNYVRTGDEAWQPFSLLLPNLRERPIDADDEMVFFGSYRKDGSTLAMRASSPEVFRCRRYTTEVLNTWPSFDAMLISEVERLSKLFDSQGRQIDPSVPTTPPDD